ncbi:hypothetical protein QBC37DRAFT_188271 [Rhypophila decipiens]|uniref:Transmembrane protein n=1 Tax=Rhypophila decipiens TaxID=261697 RepID=A0AAN7BCP7_9PEZI|nr:hypothetical protein QBC37DRAFT_188271 [Rhypophila decipiens]
MRNNCERSWVRFPARPDLTFAYFLKLSGVSLFSFSFFFFFFWPRSFLTSVPIYLVVQVYKCRLCFVFFPALTDKVHVCQNILRISSVTILALIGNSWLLVLLSPRTMVRKVQNRCH